MITTAAIVSVLLAASSDSPRDMLDIAPIAAQALVATAVAAEPEHVPLPWPQPGWPDATLEPWCYDLEPMAPLYVQVCSAAVCGWFLQAQADCNGDQDCVNYVTAQYWNAWLRCHGQLPAVDVDPIGGEEGPE